MYLVEIYRQLAKAAGHTPEVKVVPDGRMHAVVVDGCILQEQMEHADALAAANRLRNGELTLL